MPIIANMNSALAQLLCDELIPAAAAVRAGWVGWLACTVPWARCRIDSIASPRAAWAHPTETATDISSPHHLMLTLDNILNMRPLIACIASSLQPDKITRNWSSFQVPTASVAFTVFLKVRASTCKSERAAPWPYLERN